MQDPTVPQDPGYPPTLVAPQPPQRRRRRWIPALIAGVVLLGCCVAGVTASLVGDALRKARAQTNTALPRIGDPVRDGQFEFVVSGVSCGLSQIVNGILRTTPQGQYCVVDMRVTNIGREPRQFADGLQKAFGPHGEQYAADTGAGVVANGNGAAVWNVVNPGNSVSAKVVYDIPPAASLVEVELHDSALSGGTRVSLTSG